MKPKISLIAAIGKNRELGRGNELIFKIPEDMAFFREKTRGHVVIMGRKTFESIGRLLPNRINIVITRDVSSCLQSHPECNEGSKSGFRVKPGMTAGVVVSSIEEALEFGKKAEESRLRKDSGEPREIFVIGGAQIYKLALPFADKLYLTLVNSEVSEADAFFPDYSEFKTTVSEHKSSDENYTYNFLEITR